MTGKIIPTILGKEWGFPGIEPLSTFWPFMVGPELWRWCHLAYANVLQWAYHEAQDPLKVRSSAILDLVGSYQFLSYPMAVILLKFVPCPFPPVSLPYVLLACEIIVIPAVNLCSINFWQRPFQSEHNLLFPEAKRASTDRFSKNWFTAYKQDLSLACNLPAIFLYTKFFHPSTKGT